MSFSPDPELDRALACEVQRSELRRAELTFWLVLAAAVLFSALTSVGNFRGNLQDAAVVRERMTGLFGALAAMEAAVWLKLRRDIVRARLTSAVAQYLASFGEIGVITAMTAILATGTGKEIALFFPSVFAYFFIISASALSLSFWLPIFAGVLAAVEYLLLAVWLVPHLRGRMPEDLLRPANHVAKAILMAFTGVSTGLVTREIRQRARRAVESAAERDRVRSIFGQHVSPAVVDKLLAHGSAAETEVRNVCVMFLDIRNFTAFSAGQSPDHVVDYLNALFSFMVEVVNRHQGIINKFLGDGFMAVFGAPLSDGRDVEHAVAAARELVAAVEARSQSGVILPTQIGIGLHFGPVVTGSIGTEQRKEFTVIGETVNLASRLEALNKQFGTSVLASESVRAALGEARGFVSRGAVPVKGMPEPVQVYEVQLELRSNHKSTA